MSGPLSLQASLDVLADIRKYQQKMAEIPGVTAREAAKAAVRLEKEMIKGQMAAAEGARKAASKAADSWDKAARAMGRDIGRLGKGVAQLSPTLGGLAQSIGSVAKGASALATPTGLVVGGLLAMTAAAAGGALALGGTAAALGYAAFKSDEALASLEGFALIGDDFYPEVPAETLRSIEDLNGSWEAMAAIGDKLTVIVGSSVAQSFEAATSTAVGLALAGVELFEDFSEGRNLLYDFARTTTAALIGAFTLPLEPLFLLADGVLALDSAVGLLPDGAREALEVFSALGTDTTRTSLALTDQLFAFVENTAASTGLTDALGDLESTGREFVRTTLDANKALEDHKKKQDDAAKADREREKELRRLQQIELERIDALKDRIRDSVEETADGIGELQAVLGEWTAAYTAALPPFVVAIGDAAAELQRAGFGEEFAWIAAEAEVHLGRATEVMSGYLDAIDGIAGAALDRHTDALSSLREEIEAIDELLGDLSQTQVDTASLSGEALVEAYRSGAVAAEDLSEEQKAQVKTTLEAEKAALAERAAIEKAAALQAWEVQQAGAYASALVDGAAAIVAALKLGPIAGPIAAVGIGAATAIQLGTIASTEPEFSHAGSYRYPDEMDVNGGALRVLGGQGVLNRPATEAVGGPQGVNALNAGASLSPTVIFRVGRKEVREIVRTDTRTGGLLTQTIRKEARRSGKAGASGRTAVA